MTAPTQGIVYPILPLRDIVVFPGMIVPLFVGREKSVKALEEVMKDDKQILLIAQKNASQDDPGPEDIYTIGTLGTVLQLLKLPDDTVKVLVEGGKRVRITGYTDKTEFLEARAVEMEETPGDAAELQAAARTVVSEFENYVKLKFSDDALRAVAQKAILRRTGARGLRSIMETVLLDTMYDLPSLDGVDEVVINREVIEGRAQPLYVHGERKEGIAAAPA